MLCIRRIVHPTDFSPASRRAVVWAMWLAKQNQAELLVVHVLPPPTPIFEVESAELPQAEAQLSAMMRKTRWVKVKTKRLLVKGKTSVARHIVESARILQADLIVMGTHGRTGISRFFTGSVASRVIARARCPVLVVRGQSTKASSSQRTRSRH
jgi:nucleotide-binding universal stress UspA family protein